MILGMIAFSFVAMIFLCRLLVGPRRKLQSALFLVVCSYLATAAVFSLILNLLFKISLFSLALFYAGGFTVWFVVLSHLESSILLKFLVMKIATPSLSVSALLDQYNRAHGPQARFTELIEGGMLKKDATGYSKTTKTKVILHIFDLLKFFWK